EDLVARAREVGARSPREADRLLALVRAAGEVRDAGERVDGLRLALERDRAPLEALELVGDRGALCRGLVREGGRAGGQVGADLRTVREDAEALIPGDGLPGHGDRARGGGGGAHRRRAGV